MIALLKRLPASKRFAFLILLAIALTFLSFAILFLEHGVFNFGDRDLPPYRPDTSFERILDGVWFAVTIGAGLLWLSVVVYALMLLSRIFDRGDA